MACLQIKDLEKLLEKHIGNATIIDTKISRLTAPGENFGSEMLKVDLVLKNKENGAQETVNVVGKLIPATEIFRELFNIQVSFKNEIAFYDTIVPTLQQFQKQQGVNQVIDLFPKLYGARISLDGKSETVDENAVLVLENLKVSGYANVNRLKGFDLETTKLILKDLATFHAVPLALKLIKPEVFETKIQPYFKTVYPPPPEEGGALCRDILEALEEYQQCKPLIPLIRKNLGKNGLAVVREPFATITHDDLWVNNIMVKFENGKPVKNRFVDFQGFVYSSPATDLFFFLWTSVQEEVLEKNLEGLMQFYHKNFINCLQQLKCDVLPFSYSKFLKEMEIASKSQFGHALFMILIVVFRKKVESTADKDISEPKIPKPRERVFTLEAKEKAAYFVEECHRRGYTNVNRLEGFDLETTKLILKDLATFHAVPLALKLVKPEVFETKVKPYFRTVFPPPPDKGGALCRDMLEVLEEYQQCKPLIPLIKKNLGKIGLPDAREPFATITHDDVWVNNIMVKFENGKPVKNRFVDFQGFMYSSPATDLFFFLWTSVQKEVLEKNLEGLMQFYHKNFINCLQQLKCDVLPFSYSKFLKEMEIASKSQFGHALFMIMVVVFGKKFGPTADKEISEPMIPKPGKEIFTLEGKEKAAYFVEECHRRGWLT